MKQLLLFFALITFLAGWATEPVGTSGNILPGTIDGGQFSFTFAKGGGSNRIIVVKEGGTVMGSPSDGVTYGTNTTASDARFNVIGSEFTVAGEYVVYRGAATSITVKNLKPATTYHIAIFEYNIDGTPNPDYLLTPAVANITTVSAPTLQGSISGIVATGNSATVTLAYGNGKGRIIVARKGATLTATPTDLTDYASNTKFAYSDAANYTLEPGTYVVFDVTHTGTPSITVTGLEPNTTYTFAIYEYNGYSSPVYLKATTTKSVTTNAGPTKQAINVGFNAIDGKGYNVTWAPGNGTKRLVIAKKGSEVINGPVNGKRYNANAQFLSGEELLPGSGEYVVHAGIGGSVSVTNLEANSTYHFAVYEYDEDLNGYTYYMTSTAPATGSRSTALPPTGQTTMTVGTITGTTAQLTFHYPPPGERGTYVLLAIRDGGPVDFDPVEFTKYTALTNKFSNAMPVAGTNSYILYGQSSGSGTTVEGLTPGHTYHLTLFDMNGYSTPVYKRPGYSVQFTIPNEPTAGSTPRVNSFLYVEGNSFQFHWNAGDGARRVVVAKKGTEVTLKPQDGTTYTASASFGTLASEIVPGSGEFVVYDGTSSSVTLTGLEKATTYHLAVFEYNLNGSSPDYLTADGKFLAASQATVSAPTTQVSELGATDILSDRATITFKVGDGASRIFVMREGGPVDAEPAEYTSYTQNDFRVGSQIGTGNYVVGKGKTSSFVVTGLSEGTQYYITAFEFNGSTSPVYLLPEATQYNFTTTGGVVIPTPTTNSHTPDVENVDGNKFTFKWQKGDGTNRIVVARKGIAVNFIPANGQEYTANAAFGDGVDQGSGQYVVYKGSGNSVDLTKLEPSTTYHFAVFEYNGAAANTKYLTTTFLATSHSTAMTPANPASLLGTSFTSSSITFNWDKGAANGSLVIVKEDGEVTATPSNLTTYEPNTDIRNAPQLLPGERIVYANTGSSVTITGISIGKTYHFAVFPYNGSAAPVYNTSYFLKGTVVPTPLPVDWVSFTGALVNGKAQLKWVTAQEINNAGFEVERSTDGASFYKIGALVPNSNFIYQFTDQQPLEGAAYYRIKQLDDDGKASYSKTIRLQGQHTKEEIRLVQNPVQGQLKVQSAKLLLGSKLQIVSADGRVLHTQVLTSEIQIIDVQKLQKGMFYLQVFSREGERPTVLPFIKN